MAKLRTVTLACIVSFLLNYIVLLPVHADDGNNGVNPQRYTVQWGDTLLTIAGRFDISVHRLAAANDLVWNDWVFAGQQMVIPGATAHTSTAPASAEAGPLYGVDPRVPDPLPSLPLLPLERPTEITPSSYARVNQANAPVYERPSDASQGVLPKRTLGSGFVWVSLLSQTTWEGQPYYEINEGEYLSAEALSPYAPSRFHGVALAEQPERPFAWILKPVQPHLNPAGETNPEAPIYDRYDLVQIYATEYLGEQVWYLVGPHQWINQIYVGKVTVSAPPAAVESDARWVEVDLFEQTLAAYEGERMVYATLVSSGLRGWDTPPGLFQVWLRVGMGKMSGGYNRPDYYFLEDVPWSLYFNQDIALHTAYWHDGFGYRRSHGCVNLPPLDARWLYEWAPDNAWVWVHDQEPQQQATRETIAEADYYSRDF